MITRIGNRYLIPAIPLAAVFVALVCTAVFISIAQVSPIVAGQALLEGSLTSTDAIGVTGIRITPLLLAGLGVAIGIRAGLFNLGAEGQIYLGGLAAAVAGLFIFQAVPALVGIPGVLVAGFLGGALWALIPALLKAFRGVNEVITSLLLNFVGINLVTILLERPLGDNQATYPATKLLSPQLYLPIILPGSQLHAGLLVAVLVAIGVFLLFQYTNFGFELRAIGNNARAAATVGIPVRRRLVQAMLLSGGLAGVAGAVEVIGVFHRLAQGFSPGYGFDAVAVALLAYSDARLIVLSAVFFGVLRAGAPAMQILAGVPSALISVTEGLVIIFVVMGYAIQRWARDRLSRGAV